MRERLTSLSHFHLQLIFVLKNATKMSKNRIKSRLSPFKILFLITKYLARHISGEFNFSTHYFLNISNEFNALSIYDLNFLSLTY